MPEIRLGAGNNLEDVQLGGVQIEEVRLGTELVWRNNESPQVTLFRVNSVALPEGNLAAFTRNTLNTLTITATEVEMEVPYTLELFRGGVTTGITGSITTPGGSTTLNIPSTVYDSTSAGGLLVTPDDWTLLLVDTALSEEEYEFQVGTLNFAAPSISVTGSTSITTTDFRLTTGQTRTFNYTVAPSTSGTGLTTTPSGSIDVSGVSCGSGTSTETITASTVAGGVTQTVTQNVNYRIVPGTTTSSIGVTGTFNNVTAPSSVSVRFGRLCGSGATSGSGSYSVPYTPATGYRAPGNSTGSVGSGGTINVGTINGIAIQGASTATCPNAAAGSTPTVTITDTVAGVVGTITGGQPAACPSSSTASSYSPTVNIRYDNGTTGTASCVGQCAALPVFTSSVCSVSGGTAGGIIPTSALSSDLVGTLSVSPTNYVSGNNLYTVSGMIPNGFLNAGTTSTCTASATALSATCPGFRYSYAFTGSACSAGDTVTVTYTDACGRGLTEVVQCGAIFPFCSAASIGSFTAMASSPHFGAFSGTGTNPCTTVR